MPEKAVLYEDRDGTKYEVDMPLKSNLDPLKIRDELGVPSYVDMDYFPMKNALVTVWAALKAPQLHELYPQAFEKKVSDKPIPVLLFGGGAVKILCEHANGSGSLSRKIKDTDFIIPKKQGADFYRLLLGMAQAFGSHYTSFRTKSDKLFNAMRQGDRYRIRTINGVTENGNPTVTVLDMFCDAINLRHKVDIKETFEKQKQNLYTIGLENLILSKAQFIMDFPKAQAEELKQCDCEYRILPYSYYASDMFVLGMEEKDVKDVCAIFLDHSTGNGNEEIDVDRVKKVLEKDSRLALTVTLNLRNMVEKPDILAKWMSKSDVSAVVERVQALLNVLPKVEKKWDKPWWNTAVETPLIT